MIYHITPIPKPRMTNQDRWPTPPPKYRGKEWPRPCVRRYRNFQNLVVINHIELPVIGSHVIFILPMPKGWSVKKKERMNGRYHQQTPDIDNLQKALFDSTYKQDCTIADVWVTKIWGHEGQIVITKA